MIKTGDYVRMSEECKIALRKNCINEHVGPFDSGDGADDPGGECWGCSTQHIEEFGNCVGIVEGPVDFGNGNLGPEVDVRWLPSQLRYGYDPNRDLVRVSSVKRRRK